MLLLAGSGAHAQLPCTATGGLTTLYAQDNGLDGVMFDIVALQPVTIECFEVNWNAGTTSIALYYKTGTHVGFATNPGAWTLIDTVMNLTTAGSDLPTYLPIDVDVTIPGGATAAFYVTNNSTSDPNAEYTDGTVLGAVLASDANIQVLEGSGVSYIFNSAFSPRQFNGTVYYTSATTGVTDMAADVLGLRYDADGAQMILDLPEGQGPHWVSISDASGRLVLERPVNSEGRVAVDLSELGTGAYVFSVRNVKEVRTERFVKG
ncbi:MAG: T9SS type A sorting domain-containing protein [Flavobacteriales bacterium]|nr:T9SS type A sorting domain-containing protein [Flavobacteriales bacterium]